MGLANLIRTGRWSPPKKAIQVVRPLARARFDAAQTSDDSRHWANADALSANAALTPEVRRIIRNRARYERANNAYVHGICVTKSNDLIGTGPRIQLDTGNADSDRAIGRAFFDWSWSVRLADKLRTATEARVLDGEAFCMFFTNPRLDVRGVQLDLRLIEADQVASPAYDYQQTISPDGSLVDGVELDRHGNVIAYHVLTSHPGSNFLIGINEYDTIVAENMLHWFRPTRPGQHRGLSELTPCLRLTANMRRYTEAVIRAAEIAADLAAFVHSNSPAAQVDEVDAFAAIEIEKGTLTTLPEGWDISQLKAEQPTNTHQAFTRTILSEIARGVNLPYYKAAFDASSYNYSSARLDGQLHEQNVRVERDELERAWLDRIFREWLDEALLVPGMIPAGLPPASEWNWAWVWDGREGVDPNKEANATETKLATLTTSLAAEYARQGKQWDVELRQIAAERALMAELNLSIGNRPSQVVVPQAEAVAAAGEPGVIAEESYKPTAEMADEAERGLSWRREFNRGGTEIGVARARDIANGRPLSLDTVKRMASYFARHEVDKQGEGWSPGEDGYPSAGRIAWALWGGDPGRTFANSITEEANA
jgi:lambda family phage portal protein